MVQMPLGQGKCSQRSERRELEDETTGRSLELAARAAANLFLSPSSLSSPWLSHRGASLACSA